jgi:hypothetical protein
MNQRALLLTLAIPFISGCSAPEKPSITSNDPSLKIPAIRESAETHDRRAVAQLVKDLDSDDPAVRFYAIHGLKEITGNTFGYRYYEDDEERKPAIDRWKQWLRQQATTQP